MTKNEMIKHLLKQVYSLTETVTAQTDLIARLDQTIQKRMRPDETLSHTSSVHVMKYVKTQPMSPKSAMLLMLSFIRLTEHPVIEIPVRILHGDIRKKAFPEDIKYINTNPFYFTIHSIKSLTAPAPPL